MLSDRKFRKPSAKVVARLMGFEGLPHQIQVRTPYQGLRDNYIRTVSKGDDVCKDVFIVHETIKTEKVRRRRSVESFNSERICDTQRSMNGKCQELDWRVQRRVEIGDLTYGVDSNKEVFVEFLRNPSSLLKKHLRGLQSYDVEARCFCKTARKMMRNSFSELKYARRNSIRQQECLCCNTRNTSIGKHGSLDLEQHTGCSESEYEVSTLPARIVVLEPNRRRSNKQHTAESVWHSHSYSSPDSNYETKKISVSRSSNVKRCTREIYGHQLELSLQNKRKPDKFRRSTRKVIHGLQTAALRVIPKKSTGYAGDESSFYSSEDELTDALESGNSVHSFGQSYSSSLHVKHKSYHSVNCETSDKWQQTKLSKRAALCNILSVSDKEDMIRPLNSRIERHETNTYGFEANDDCIRPLCMYSMKAKYLRDSSRNISVRCPSAADSSYWTTENSGFRSNPSQVDMNENETLTFRNEKLSRHRICRNSSKVNSDYYSKSALVNSYEADASSSIHHHVSEYKHPVPAESLAPLEEVPNDDVMISTLDILDSQEVFTQHSDDILTSVTDEFLESVSPLSSKETEQPSPVSVLEFPNADASSGSEYFGRVSADLQGLMAQVRMLKLELAQEDDKPELLQTNYEIGKDAVTFSDEKGLLLDQISDSSYIADVLAACGFEDADPRDLFSVWNLPNVPMELSVFEKLERKYSENATQTRSKRRLLFDHINSELVGILNQITSPCLWGTFITKKFMSGSTRALKDDISKLIVIQEHRDGDENFELQRVGLIEGLYLWENIHEIGKELEQTLIDELVAEIFREGLW